MRDAGVSSGTSLYAVRDDAGNLLNAHLELVGDALVLHSRGGAKGTPKARNTQYSEALRFLLSRLIAKQLAISGIWVDSNRVQALPFVDRLVLHPEELATGAAEAFSLLSKRIAKVGSATGAANGGNSHKRLAIRLVSKEPAEALVAKLGLAPVGSASATVEQPRIFASSVWGMDFDKWGAWGFADKGTRDRLASEMGPGDYVLSIGTQGKETIKEQRGRLLALIRIGLVPVATRELVEPAFYAKSVAANGGVERWPHGFPIKGAEAFSPIPLRSKVLPRLHEKNLFMKLARHYVELTAEEAEAVLALPRVEVEKVFSRPRPSFVAHLRKGVTGPPPSQATRLLTPKSGPAATYVMELHGSALSHMDLVFPAPGCSLFKIGYSNSPPRRRDELNAYLPCEKALCWQVERTQWHDDEVNAYAMEQEVFLQLEKKGIGRIKGEIVACSKADLEEVWENALQAATRPTKPVLVPAAQA